MRPTVTVFERVVTSVNGETESRQSFLDPSQFIWSQDSGHSGEFLPWAKPVGKGMLVATAVASLQECLAVKDRHSSRAHSWRHCRGVGVGKLRTR